MQQRKEICLVTGGSKNDTAPIGVLLLNLKETQPWINNIVIFHDGITTNDQKVMKSILPVDFIKYSFPGNKIKFNEIVKYKFTEMVFCKYECFRLLDRFNTVIWTDYDVLFQKDVKELISECPTGMRTLMYRQADDVSTLRRQLRKGYEHIIGERYDLNALSMATGLFVIDRNLPASPQELYSHCIQLTECYGDCLCLPEQAVFDMLFQDFKIVPGTITWDYATHPSSDTAYSAPILHAYAQPKFWNGLENPKWKCLYEQWINLGGSKKSKYYYLELLRKMSKSIVYRWKKLKGRINL